MSRLELFDLQSHVIAKTYMAPAGPDTITPGMKGVKDPAFTEPRTDQVEEVDAMLDEDPPTLCPVPEPVTGRQPLVARTVDQHAVQRCPQYPALDEPPHRIPERPVTHHEIDA